MAVARVVWDAVTRRRFAPTREGHHGGLVPRPSAASQWLRRLIRPEQSTFEPACVSVMDLAQSAPPQLSRTPSKTW